MTLYCIRKNVIVQYLNERYIFPSLANFGSDLNLGFQKTAPSTTPTSGSQTPNLVPPTTPQHSGSTATTPKHQPKSPSGPDYSRSHFDAVNKNQQPQNDTKPKPKSDDVFGDLLGSQGYNFTGKKDVTPKTINAMRKEEMVTYMDPEKLKVMEWVSRILKLFHHNSDV